MCVSLTNVRGLAISQGMGFVTAMFLMYTVTEEDAFWMLVQMVEKYQMGGLWDKARSSASCSSRAFVAH